MLSMPEDYGLDPAQTLEHVCVASTPDGFDAFWASFREEVESVSERFVSPVDPSTTRAVLPSISTVRIAGRLSWPEGAPAGAVITSHGYGAVPEGFDDEPEPWTDHAMLTLRLRVRGYPPSTMDVDDYRGDWILHNIRSPAHWILRGAVADLVCAYRCLRRQLGRDMPICLHGESFGAGLAVLAASQLEALGDPPSRLALGLPTFGDWTWRRDRYCNGAGGQVNLILESLRTDAAAMLEGLLLFDTALHARRVRSPALVKLATRDDTVPAPTAAAVYNALASDQRWRFVTSYGHFDGGLADLRRHVLFERLHATFLDPDTSLSSFDPGGERP